MTEEFLVPFFLFLGVALTLASVPVVSVAVALGVGMLAVGIFLIFGTVVYILVDN